MSSEYSRSVLKMVVASICQTVGWHSINSTPLEFMVDLMREYLLRISKLTHQYSEILGRTEPNLDDLGLAFRYMNIDIQELAEYVKNVDSVPCPIQVPQYPVRRENHLNFLKPGSREVVTRPVHVHEHLPAMYPDTEEEYIVDKSESLTNGTADLTPSSGTSSSNSNNTSPHRLSPQGIFKRPGDPISFESPIVKRTKVVEEGRPLREISSVMMTTSGFLSPAREGKLPEARTPHQVRADSPQPTSYPMVPPELKCDKKPKKVVKKGPEDRKLDKENKKKKGAKELFKPDKIDDSKIKKLVGMKELAKLKPLKPGGGKAQAATLSQELSGSRPSTPKIASPKSAGSPKPSKVAQLKAKVTEKVIDLTDTPPPVEKKEDTIDKLPSEPDKQKLNIFKKISKPREEKDKDKETVEPPHKYKDLNSRECSPALIIDENTEKQHAAHRNDVVAEVKRIEEKKTPHTPDLHVPPTYGDLVDVQSPSSDVYMFDDTDISPPGTPSSTPKTPELNVPTVVEQKQKKKKEKSGKKKEPKLKSPKQCVSPKKTRLANDVVEPDVPDRPKTPQAPEPPLHREPTLPPTLPFPFFPAFPPAPGLIPPPMFSRFPLPLSRGGPGLHPAMPNLAIPPRFPNPPIKPEDFVPNPLSKIKPIEREKLVIPPPPVELVPPSIINENEKADKEKVDNNKITKMFKSNKELPFMKVPERVIAPPIVTAPVAPPIMLSTPPVPATQVLPSKNLKAEKTEKNDTINSKSKEHKKEKKDKLKKKKDKKEKHKDKGEKIKEKKEKAEKREKLEKLKEKKEKKEKKKEKDTNKKNTVPTWLIVNDNTCQQSHTMSTKYLSLQKEDKNPEAVPKITLKLGTASPRPATPDNTPMKKITIKPLVKKPDEDVKREPSPELAKISALVTRPPKQKSTSKKTEEGILDGSPALPTDSFSANLTSVPPASAPRTKKSIYQSEPLPSPHFDPAPKLPNPLAMPQQPPYYFDRGGRQVWICPACGNQDDGSPMIGCDDCDAWYHWVCVGMQVPPADDEDWYCRFCIAKKQELLHDKKKKKRKKKVKVTA